MSPVVTHERYASATLDTFLGMSQDRSGVELLKNEFRTLTNVRNNNLRGLSKRLGGDAVFAEVHTNSNKVRGTHTFTNDAGTETYIKILQDGTVFKSTGSSWTQITASAPTFADADAFFATMSTRDTGAANTSSGTLEEGTATSVKDNDLSLTDNALVGDVLVVNNETKFITANDATTIFVGERFDTTPSTEAFTANPTAQEFFIANGTNFYKCDGTTFTRLDNSAFAYAFDGIETHTGRLWGWKGNRLHYSDLAVGEHFSRNSFLPFNTPIQRAKSFGDIIVVYEREKVSVVRGNRPDNFSVEEILNIGTTAPKSVANYYSLYQLFLSERYGVILLSREKLRENQGEPVSVSESYRNNEILAQTSANLQASCAEVHRDSYHLCIDNDWYRLNIKASEDTGFRHWIWTDDDRPAAMDANTLGHYGTRFVAGAQDNGQVYQIEQPSTFDDDGTDITMTIEKRDWNPTKNRDIKHFAKLKVTQPTTAGAVTMNYFADPDGSTYGSAMQIVALNTAGTEEHDIVFTANASNIKNIGRKMSIQITETSGVEVSEIEELQLLYLPGVST